MFIKHSNWKQMRAKTWNKERGEKSRGQLGEGQLAPDGAGQREDELQVLIHYTECHADCPMLYTHTQGAPPPDRARGG